MLFRTQHLSRMQEQKDEFTMSDLQFGHFADFAKFRNGIGRFEGKNNATVKSIYQHENNNSLLQILVQCPHLGCPLVSFKKKIAVHAEFCEHRVFMCPMQKYKYDEECGWTGKVNFILVFQEFAKSTVIGFFV